MQERLVTPMMSLITPATSGSGIAKDNSRIHPILHPVLHWEGLVTEPVIKAIHTRGRKEEDWVMHS